ncbi:hypothetical protein PULV_a4270 [Pseudoalteromonas ulvae UL12]|nr:hypothetical protein [Pseudoalteromonas ulvae UL12]
MTAQLQRSEAEVDLIRTFADIQPFVMPGKQSGLIAEHINYVDDYVINNAALQLNGQFELLGYTQQIVVTASHTDANRNNDYLAAPEVEGIVMLDDYSAKRIDTSKRPAFSKSTDDGLFDTTETGLAIATRFQLTDELFTIAGIKFNQYEQHIMRSARRQDVSFDENTPTHYSGVLYSISENITLYSSCTDIYRPHSEKFDINNKPLDSETANNIELGFKSPWLNDNLYFTGTYFETKKKDVPQMFLIINSDRKFAYRQIDGAQTTGYEFETRAHLTNSWQISAGYSKFEIESSDGTEINTELPRTLLNMHSTYDWKDFTIGVGLQWQDDKTYNAITPQDASMSNWTGTKFEENRLTTLDLFAHYNLTEHAKIGLNIKNATDKTYVAGFDQTTKRMAEPRNYSF